MSRTELGRITAVLLAVITIVTIIFFVSGIPNKSARSLINWICFFIYPITFLLLFFSYRKWVRIVFLIAGIFFILLMAEIAMDYSSIAFGVVCISSLASYIIAIIYPRMEGSSSRSYPPVSRPLSDDYIRSTELYKQMRDMMKDW